MTRSLLCEGEVLSLAPSGEGVVRQEDGRRCLVAGALPGERVRFEPPRKGNRGRLVALLRASGDRREPPCPHAQRCGGCDLMHVAEPAQLHLSRVAELLSHAVPRVPPLAVHTPSPPLGYRARARLEAVAGEAGVALGYRAARSHEVVAVDACLVLRPELDAVLPALREALRPSRGRGELRLALGEGARPVVDIRWRQGVLASATYEAAAEQVRAGRWAGVELWAESVREPVRYGDAGVWATAADGQPLRLAGFGQASEEGGNALARRVAELTGGGGRICELFAGAGTLSVLLAPLAEPFVAVEQSAAAVACLHENLRRRGLRGKVHVADANAFVIPRPTRTVVLDPPRAGAPGAVRAIAAARPREVVYVSCDMVSFARDSKALCEAGYELAVVELFELFPQTSHVELVAKFERRS